MRLRSQDGPATRLVEHGLCIVMVCTDSSEAEGVSRQLLKLNRGVMVTYRRAEDMIYNAPAGKVALVILATEDSATTLSRTLRWLKSHWPGSSVAIVGDVGCGEHEMTARQGGAAYLTRPVLPEQWYALVSHAVRGRVRTDLREMAQ